MEINDEEYLEKLGYKQELKREMTSFSNFALSFSVISVITGISSLFLNGLNYGGPATLVWGWMLVFVFVFMVALSIAEIASAQPTSGALYYWAANLAPENPGFWSWVTGWFNLIGQVATTSAIDYGLATVALNVVVTIYPQFEPVAWHNFALFFIILSFHGIINTFGTSYLKLATDISAWWHILGTIVLAGGVSFCAPRKQSASFVFTEFHINRDSGVDSPVYTFLIGLLTAQFTFTGFDASAHMSEETKNASIAGPSGIIVSVLASFIAGFILIVGLLIAIPDIDAVLKGNGLMIIFQSSIGESGAIALSFIVMVAMFFSGMASLTSNSRMIFAFSRDGAIPYSEHWHRIDPKTKTPVNGVWLGVLLATFFALPSLTSPFLPLSAGVPLAFTAVSSIAVIGLYISYVIPVYLKNTSGRHVFVKGPFHLGQYSPIIGWISVLWVCFISVIFIMPTSFANVSNRDTYTFIEKFNFTGPMVLLCVLFFIGWYYVDAKRWFKGPHKAELEVASEDLKI